MVSIPPIPINPDYTAIALVVDRSGSMQRIDKKTKEGVTQFITTQKQNPGKARFTLVQFDHEYEVIHRFCDLKEINENSFAEQYSPRGTTALLDAVGRTIIEMSQNIESPEHTERPAHVIIAIITDGEENASQEFKSVVKIKELVNGKRALGWNFMFLTADLNAFRDGHHYGFQQNEIVSFNTSQTRTLFDSVGLNISQLRLGASSEVHFSDADRALLALSPLPFSLPPARKDVNMHLPLSQTYDYDAMNSSETTESNDVNFPDAQLAQSSFEIKHEGKANLFDDQRIQFILSQTLSYRTTLSPIRGDYGQSSSSQTLPSRSAPYRDHAINVSQINRGNSISLSHNPKRNREERGDTTTSPETKRIRFSSPQDSE